MTIHVNETSLTEIAVQHGYDDAEYSSFTDTVTISRHSGEEGFVLVSTCKGWIAGLPYRFGGYVLQSRVDTNYKHALNSGEIALLCADTEAYPYFTTPESCLIDIFDYGIEPAEL